MSRAESRRCPGCGDEYQPTCTDQKTCSRRCVGFLQRTERGTWPTCKVWPRTCRGCGGLFIARRRKTLVCSQGCHMRWLRRVRAVPVPGFICAECGTAIESTTDRITRPRSKFCSRTCYRRSQHEDHRGRARRYGVAYEPINSIDVYKRDRWRCGLCSKTVDPEALWPDRMCASLDHVVPMSQGGGHVRANVQLAHWLCNAMKGDRGGPEQLRLLG